MKRSLGVMASALLALGSTGTSLADTVPDAGGYSFTLKQLGRYYPINLHGTEATDSVNFDVRTDQVVTGAHLNLQYNYSPSLLPDLSQINILVNDEVAASIALAKDTAGSLQNRTVDIPAQLITEKNRLSMQFIGHYTMGCEDPTHSSLWAKVSNNSVLELQTTPLTMPDDLATLPAPFFDPRDARKLSLPFVFASAPSGGVLEAAGALSSWFGALAKFRGANFPVQIGGLPAHGNAVVLFSGDAPGVIGGLELPTPKGSTLTIMANPNDKYGKLLVVSGRNTDELKRAASALALGGKALSGASTVIEKLDVIAPRKPYDAPNWLPSDRLVRLGELIDTKRLNVSGYNPGDITIALNLPPDLFNWRQSGAQLDLKYRYTPQPKSNNSSFIISFNDGMLKSETLPSMESLDKSLLSSIKDEALYRETRLNLPLGSAALQSRLQLRFMYDFIKQGECGDIIIDNMRGSIDPESTVDLRAYDHFIAMPNLGVFKDSGFPFTRMADLSQTVAVLPDDPGTGDISAYLTVLGRFGLSTGYPATGVTVAQAAQVSSMADRDLLVFASGNNQPLLLQWADRLPAIAAEQQRVELSDLPMRVLNWFSADEVSNLRRTRLAMAFTSSQPGAYLTGFESPLKSGRSVVVIAGGDAGGLAQATSLLTATDDDTSGIQGSLVVVRGKTAEALVADQQYYLGNLGPFKYLQWLMSQHVGWMVLITGLGILLLGALAYMGLRAKARKRLEC
ncbi:cellulose biosynthesis cyclic di-GMP-binding regulatory protein BcsB [Pseudomonas sp. Pseusp122]|uniref:cellulose biosynthesis cyclic di-GMP-binding regulatory protein BcsB n=1 Tax=unclassified Pseudomonas TaxID=196821 RepID=UPI0039A45DD8